jgi:hypothetical protein
MGGEGGERGSGGVSVETELESKRSKVGVNMEKCCSNRLE